MNVLVTFAVAAEFAPWRRRRHFRRILPTPHPIYECRIGDSGARVAITGMGWENARRVVRAALDMEIPAACISSGLAGGLKPAYRSADVLAARAVGEFKGSRRMESDAELLAAAGESGARIVDLFLTSRQLVVASEEKRQLGLFGDAVEMESVAVLAEATGCGVPAIAIRAVSDPVEEDLPLDFHRVTNDRGQVRYSQLLAQVAARPSRVPGLVRLGRASRRASEKLADFLDRYIPALAGRGLPPMRQMVEELAAT